MQMYLCLIGGCGLLYTVISLFIINKGKASPLLRYINIAGACTGVSLCAYFFELLASGGESKLMCIRFEMIALAEFIIAVSYLSLSFGQIKLPATLKKIFNFYAVTVICAVVFSSFGSWYIGFFDLIVMEDYKGVLTLHGPLYFGELVLSCIVGVM